MNIDDVSNASIEVPLLHEVMPKIFEKQMSLITKYIEIERRNGFYKPDLNLLTKQAPIDDAQFQNWLKNTFWRTTEELAEAVEEVPDLTGKHWERWDSDHVLRHFYEEVIDATHFFVEASVYLRISPASCGALLVEAHQFMEKHQLARTADNVHTAIHHFIMAMGLAANCLKNKPWKSTHMQTDISNFQSKMTYAWHSFCMVLAMIDIDHTKLYQLYFKKNAVNQFRQKTNY